MNMQLYIFLDTIDIYLSDYALLSYCTVATSKSLFESLASYKLKIEWKIYAGNFIYVTHNYTLHCKVTNHAKKCLNIYK